jgi:hypothetical protein
MKILFLIYFKNFIKLFKKKNGFFKKFCQFLKNFKLNFVKKHF